MARREVQIRQEPGLWPPSWPLGLTMLRLLLLPVFLLVLLSDANTDQHPRRWLAVAIFGVMAVTDKLDGYLARKLNQTSKIGALLDPVADKLLVACSVILLSFEWMAPRGFRIPGVVVGIIYGKDLVVALGSLALLSLVGKVTITPRPLGKAGTFLQLSMVIGTLIAIDLQRWNAPVTWWLTRSLWVAVAAVTSAACVDYFIQGCKQFAQSPKGVVAEATAPR